MSFTFSDINSRFVCRGPVHNLINSLASSFPLSLEHSRSEPEFRDMKRQRTQSYPVYMLNLHCPLSSYDLTFEPSKTVVEFKVTFLFALLCLSKHIVLPVLSILFWSLFKFDCWVNYDVFRNKVFTSCEESFVVACFLSFRSMERRITWGRKMKGNDLLLTLAESFPLVCSVKTFNFHCTILGTTLKNLPCILALEKLAILDWPVLCNLNSVKSI